jgi:hypothetical protein
MKGPGRWMWVVSIEGQLKILTRIRLGAPGALDVFVDGQKTYSKKQTGWLPTADEIIELIRDRGVRAAAGLRSVLVSRTASRGRIASPLRQPGGRGEGQRAGGAGTGHGIAGVRSAKPRRRRTFEYPPAGRRRTARPGGMPALKVSDGLGRLGGVIARWMASRHTPHAREHGALSTWRAVRVLNHFGDS